ncbi:MAG: 23S rRNA (adenine(2503)-C(2))-methyltransferase RlmN [Candidatus Magasanikbacteria bacterium]|nr:23S rRNA (adenine(2503)-C(2))-methyltransferase RlmN [Candidatus Magasanikbacteria bacterium]
MIGWNDVALLEPKYRREQIYRAWFDAGVKGIGDISTLPKDLREKFYALLWMPIKLEKLLDSKLDDTKRALLRLSDGEMVETVLMGRQSKKISPSAEKRYTICVSSQVGCPMKCVFCATGRAGFKRNLSMEEIVAQFRFWQEYLRENRKGEIGNVVFMGQGEPLLNYEAVKNAMNILIKFANLGHTKITLSTAGVVAGMEKMIDDPDFPPIRFALSLHSAIPDDRKKLIPSQPEDFFEFLIGWSKKYHIKFASRTHFVGLEYMFIGGINDSDRHLKALIKLASKLGRVRLNLIPYNSIDNDKSVKSADFEIIKSWQQTLMKSGFTTTVRLSQGSDIAAACGQLKNSYDNR